MAVTWRLHGEWSCGSDPPARPAPQVSASARASSSPSGRSRGCPACAAAPRSVGCFPAECTRSLPMAAARGGGRGWEGLEAARHTRASTHNAMGRAERGGRIRPPPYACKGPGRGEGWAWGSRPPPRPTAQLLAARQLPGGSLTQPLTLPLVLEPLHVSPLPGAWRPDGVRLHLLLDAVSVVADAVPARAASARQITRRLLGGCERRRHGGCATAARRVHGGYTASSRHLPSPLHSKTLASHQLRSVQRARTH